jgi:hypothetical protein
MGKNRISMFRTAYEVGRDCAKQTQEMFDRLGNLEDNCVQWYRGYSEHLGMTVSESEEAKLRGWIRKKLAQHCRIQSLAVGISQVAGSEIAYLHEFLAEMQGKPTASRHSKVRRKGTTTP